MQLQPLPARATTRRQTAADAATPGRELAGIRLRGGRRTVQRLVSAGGFLLLAIGWQLTLRKDAAHLMPTPPAIVRGVFELAASGLLARHVVASLFRVLWGFWLAAAVGIAAGLLLGRSRLCEHAFAPFIHVFRPISALAWIPLAILFFGVGDLAAVFVIFIASIWPITFQTFEATRRIPEALLLAASNFQLQGLGLLRQVIVPAITPDLITALRVTLGIAWMVDVAAEMIGVNSGLGFLIVDARNAGNRYDLVIGGMLIVGCVGLSLDRAIARAQRFDGRAAAAASAREA